MRPTVEFIHELCIVHVNLPAINKTRFIIVGCFQKKYSKPKSALGILFLVLQVNYICGLI